jgi:hypothetical protein
MASSSSSSAHEPSLSSTGRGAAAAASGAGGSVLPTLGRSVLGLTQPLYKVGPPTLDDLPVDLREKYETYRNRPSRNHPLYMTQSKEYGSVPKGIPHKVVNPVAGKQGGFSQTFTTGGANRSQSLITSIARSRFHSALDA